MLEVKRKTSYMCQADKMTLNQHSSHTLQLQLHFELEAVSSNQRGNLSKFSSIVIQVSTQKSEQSLSGSFLSPLESMWFASIL